MLIKIQNVLKKIISSMCIVLLFGAVGIVLLCVVYMLPTEKMSQHVYKDIYIIEEEGNYPEFAEGYFVRMHPNNINVKTFLLNNRGMARDNYTDAIMLGNAIFSSTEKPLLEKVMQVYRVNEVECQPIDNLKATFLNDNPSIISYPRYWHGYLVFLKPLLMIFTYTQIKYLNILLQMLLLYFLLKRICVRLGKEYAVALGNAILFTFPFVIPMCMQYSTMTYVMLISSNVLLWKWEFWKDNFRYAYFFLVVGCSTCYFDFLTYPVVSLGIPLLLYLSMEQGGSKRKMQIASNACVMWGIGYGGIWMLKWMLATWLGQSDVMRDALEQVLYRMSGDTATQASGVSIIKAVLANFSCYTNILFIVLIIVTFIVMCKRMHRKHIAVSKLLQEQWLSLVVSLLPLIWFVVLKNHSYDHSSFTYRALIVTVFGVWTSILNMSKAGNND